MPEERRLVTVLFADVVGSTALPSAASPYGPATRC